MSVRIIVDSASDISEKEANDLGIIMIPMSINFEDEEYLDGVDLLPSQFYDKLIESDVLPKTSQVSVYKFEQVFEKCVSAGDEVVAITISSKLSGTYNSAVQASANYPEKVFVVDSLNACIGERLLVQYALRLVDEGKSAKEISEILDSVKSKINVMALLNTLEYLKKGGRISATAAFAGKLISLKPVVAVIDGEVKLVGKALGSRNGGNLLNKLIQDKKGIDFDMPYGVIWSGLDDALLKKYVEDSAHLWKNKTDYIPSYILGGTIGTHVGPGAIGVAFFEL